MPDRENGGITVSAIDQLQDAIFHSELEACGVANISMPADPLELYEWATTEPLLSRLDEDACSRLADLRANLAQSGLVDDRVEYAIVDPDAGLFVGTCWFLPIWAGTRTEPTTSVQTFSSVDEAQAALAGIADAFSKSYRPVFNQREPGRADLEDLRASLFPESLTRPMASDVELAAGDEMDVGMM